MEALNEPTLCSGAHKTKARSPQKMGHPQYREGEDEEWATRPTVRSYKMSKRKPVVIFVSLIVLAGLAVAVHGVHRVDANALDELIHQRLPPGTDQTAVLAFLNSQHINHTEYVRDRQMIQAGISRSSIGLLTGRIHIDFWFDENGKLVRSELVELFDFL